jgi:hypothetical protein
VELLYFDPVMQVSLTDQTIPESFENSLCESWKASALISFDEVTIERYPE